MSGAGDDFHDVLFPPLIARGAQGGPAYATAVLETAGGRERRTGSWAQSRGRWNVGTGLKRRGDYALLLAFFHARRGRLHGFRFRDWSDHQAVGETLGAGDGARTRFRLLRRYSSGGAAVERWITRPVAGTLALSVGGEPLAEGAAVLEPMGWVAFASPPAPGAAVSASFLFDVPARFDTDHLPLNLEHLDLAAWPDVPVVELRDA